MCLRAIKKFSCQTLRVLGTTPTTPRDRFWGPECLPTGTPWGGGRYSIPLSTSLAPATRVQRLTAKKKKLTSWNAELGLALALGLALGLGLALALEIGLALRLGLALGLRLALGLGWGLALALALALALGLGMAL